MSRAHSYGNWDNTKYVYKCRNLNTGTDDCGSGVDSADFLVTVKAQTSRYVTIELVEIYPNNLQSVDWGWLYSDVRIDFSVRNQLIYSGRLATQGPKIQLTIPSQYSISDTFVADDHCYLNFTGTCSLSSTTLVIYPTETIKSTDAYRVYLVQAVKAPLSTTTGAEYAWLGETFFQGVTVDDQAALSTDSAASMYVQTTAAAVAGTNDLTELRVFPDAAGEYAQYTFRLQYTDNVNT